MAIERAEFVEAGRWMMVPLDLLNEDLRSLDKNGSGTLHGPEEFAALYDKVLADGLGQAGLVSVSSTMRQAVVQESASLKGGTLRDVAELRPVWNGFGRIERARGVTAGTRAIQEALNEISAKLSDYPKTDVGAADGMFGPRTEAGVKAFQAVHRDLDTSGKVDQPTLEQLDAVLARARTIVVNPVEPVEPGRLQMITYNDRFGNDCVLTFDDGPDPDTNKVLDALSTGGVRGVTFFVQGINVRRYPAILRRIVEEGHVLGNHTYDHPDLRQLSESNIQQQLRRCQDAVDDALGRFSPMRQMRPPYGALNDRVRGVLRALNMAVLLWQVDSNDWRQENRRNPENIVRNVFGGSAPVTGGRGGLVLFHDIHPSTGTILPEILRRLKEAGLNHTTVQALLERKYGATPVA